MFDMSYQVTNRWLNILQSEPAQDTGEPGGCPRDATFIGAPLIYEYFINLSVIFIQIDNNISKLSMTEYSVT